MRRFNIGDPVIYTKQKVSNSPGRRAKLVHSSPKGEQYAYLVDKYWRVFDVDEDEDRVILVTRSGKLHEVSTDDNRMRKLSWWEKLLYKRLFPDPGVEPREEEFAEQIRRD